MPKASAFGGFGFTFLLRYFVQRQLLQDQPDDSSSDGDSSEPSLPHCEELSINPDKVGLIEEMFPQLSNDEIILLLSLLRGNMHKVISVCLKGLNTSIIIQVFKSARMLTMVKKVTLIACSVMHYACTKRPASTLQSQ